MAKERCLQSRVLYEGRVVRLEVDRVRLPDGSETTREVVRHRGAVAVVAIEDDDRVWLVRQHRYATGEDLLELPAGKLEPGEDPDGAVRRELLEEVGVEAAHWVHLCTFYSSPGFSDETLALYLASELTPVDAGDRPHVEGEFLTRELWRFDDALDAVTAGQIRDAKTIAGLLLAARRR